MELTLTRNRFTEKSTTGILKIEGGAFECFTLEDVDRGLTQNTPVHDITQQKTLHPKQVCIPYGRYEIAMTFSNRFQKVMPQILHVPGFDGIRIHQGNKSADTEGCLLVGDSIGDDIISGSATAFSHLYPILQDACSKEKVMITIQK